MSHWKSFGLAIFVAVGLLGESVGLAYAQCIRSSEQPLCATEWSSGGPINLGGPPGFTTSAAAGINDAGQVVGYSLVGNGSYVVFATRTSNCLASAGKFRISASMKAINASKCSS